MAAFFLQTTLPSTSTKVIRKETAMNLTSVNRQNTLKNLKARYVGAAAGVALAMTAILVAAPWHQATAPATVAPASITEPLHRAPVQTLYVVNSLAEGHELMGYLTPGTVVVAGTPQHDLLYGVQAWAMEQAGVDYLIVDLTRPVAQPAKALSPASEADIIASVLSSERANFLDLHDRPAAITSAIEAERAALITALEQFLVSELSHGQSVYESIEDYAARESTALKNLGPRLEVGTTEAQELAR
jgi:hypothetical protein